MIIILDDGSESTMEEFIESGKQIESVVRDELDYQILAKLHIAKLEQDINKGV